MPDGSTAALFRLHRMLAPEQAAPEAPPVLSTVPDDMEALEELVRRFFRSEERRQVRLLPAALPSGFDIPLPPEARVVGSVVFAEEDSEAKAAQIILDVAMEPREVEKFFQEELSKSGWLYSKSALPVFVSSDGEPAGSRVFTPFCNEEENLSMFLRLIPLQEQRSEVHLQLLKRNRAFCDRQAPPNLPTLKVPAGTAPVDSGSGGGTDNANGDATLVTNLPAEALEEHFRDQLATSGWTIVAQGCWRPHCLEYLAICEKRWEALGWSALGGRYARWHDQRRYPQHSPGGVVSVGGPPDWRSNSNATPDARRHS